MLKMLSSIPSDIESCRQPNWYGSKTLHFCLKLAYVLKNKYLFFWGFRIITEINISAVIQCNSCLNKDCGQLLNVYLTRHSVYMHLSQSVIDKHHQQTLQLPKYVQK